MGLSKSRSNNIQDFQKFEFMPKEYLQGKSPLNLSELDQGNSGLKEKLQRKKVDLKQVEEEEEDRSNGRIDLQTEIVNDQKKQQFIQQETETVVKQFDQRKQVSNQYPFSAVGLLIAQFPSKAEKIQALESSATIISSKYIITAAHGVYDHKYGEKAQKASFFIGQTCIYKVKVIDFFIPQQYTKLPVGQRARYDYAILTLEENTLERYFGSLGLCTCWKYYHTDMNVTIIGYPSDLNPNNRPIKTKYTETRQIIGIDEQNILKHQLSTSEGSSGAPLIINIKGRYYIIGIHVQGFKGQHNYNRGVLFDEFFRKQINKWISRENHFLKIQNNLDEDSKKKISKNKFNQIIANNNKQLRQIPQNLGQVQSASCNVDIIIVQGNKINKILNLQNCLWLKNLNLSNNRIQKIENLEKLRQLQKLKLNKNKITKIEGLNSLKNLLKLNLSDNKIERIQNLQELQQLVVLALSDNKIKKVEGLDKNKEIQHLLLNKNQIIQISLNNLLCLPKLKTIRIYYNPLSDVNQLRDQRFQVYGID